MHIPTSKVELYAAIRRDHRAGLSMRALERKYGGDLADDPQGPGLELARAPQEAGTTSDPAGPV
jgi:hypothetical protein